MRLIAIGDIHGHLDKLNSLLNQVQPTAADQLVFLGDYVDRGPDSKGVIARLIRLQADFPKTIFLRGNHDQMFLDCLKIRGQGEILADWRTLAQLSANPSVTQDRDIERAWFNNGGGDTLYAYGDWHRIPDTHIEFLKQTRLTWRHDPFLFVHAGALPDFEAEEQDLFVLLWSRFSPPGQSGEIHVVGHTPIDTGLPKFEPGRIWLDTGAAYDRHLTACDVVTKELWQAE